MKSLPLKTATLVLTVGILGSIDPAFAGTITQTINTGSFQTPEWNSFLSINRFDTLGGTRTLDSVVLSLTGNLQGSVAFENRTARASNVNSTLSSGIFVTSDLLGPGSQINFIDVTPIFQQTTAVSAFDGVRDFGGTSGRTFNVGPIEKQNDATYTSGLIFDSFIGGGTLDLEFFANSTSFATGPGTLDQQFSVLSSASLTVTYNYSEAVPEPSIIGGAILGSGFIWVRRRIRAAGKKG